MAVKKETKASEVKEGKKFSLKVLRDNCVNLFGVTSSTFAGATVDLADEKFTITEVKTKVDTWLKKGVK